ncbi:tetratricopeptide repeat protein [Hydrogenimonas sp.]
MIRYLLPLLLLGLSLQAGLLDFMTLKEAKRAYAAREYEKSAQLYGRIADEKGSDEARFNAADARYKAGDYKGALKLFEEIGAPELAFEKWHNIGNCYAHLEKVDEAIDAYEKALKLKEDKATRFNLELMKRLKEAKRNEKPRNGDGRKGQKSPRKGEGNKKSQKSQGGGSDRSKADTKSGRDQSQRGNNGAKNAKSGSQREHRQPGQKGAEEERENKKSQKMNKARSEAAAKKKSRQRGSGAEPHGEQVPAEEPISDMEVRKWNKELNRRGIRTLMLPLPTQGSQRSDDETHPW